MRASITFLAVTLLLWFPRRQLIIAALRRIVRQSSIQVTSSQVFSVSQPSFLQTLAMTRTSSMVMLFRPGNFCFAIGVIFEDKKSGGFLSAANSVVCIIPCLIFYNLFIREPYGLYLFVRGILAFQGCLNKRFYTCTCIHQQYPENYPVHSQTI